MCDPISIGTALVGAAASVAMAPKAPKMQEPAAPEKPPQAVRTPDRAAVRAGRAAPSGTMLTGASGVGTSALNLGRNTLLGG